MIELRQFKETDIARLIGWIPDGRFLLQWAGPKYTFPLDAAQLRATLAQTEGDHPSHLMFKAVQRPGESVIGHIELMNLDYQQDTALLGRVLIGSPEGRGRGLGKQLVEAALQHGFDTMGLKLITLGVFDFNMQAIACYRSLGFAEYELKPEVRRFGEESWTLLRMRLDRDTWIKNHELRTARCSLRGAAPRN